MPVTARLNPLLLTQDEYEQWLRESNMTIGGTAASAVLGLNPNKSPADVWDSIVRHTPGERSNRRMDRGHAMEPIIAQIFAEETFRALEGDGQTRTRHAQYWFLHATPDRVQSLLPHPTQTVLLPSFIRQVSPRNMRGVLEIKCLGTRTFQETKLEGVAPMYYTQLQHYIDVLGLRWGSFAIFNAEEWALHWFDVPRDEPFINAMRQELVRFWNEHILTRQRPAVPDSGTAPVVQAPRFVGTEAQVMESPVWRQALVALANAKDALKLAEHNHDLAAQRVKDMMLELGHERVRVPGVGSVTWLARTTTSFDRERLAADHPDIDLAAYTRTTESRAFTLRPERAGRS